LKQFPSILVLILPLLAPVAGRCAEPPAKPAADHPPTAPSASGADKMMKMMGEVAGGSEVRTPVSGKVVEVLDGGTYSYFCLEKEGKKTWIAVPKMHAKVGDELTFKPGNEMTNFTSKTLNRTFEKIIFSDGTAVQQPAAAKPAEDTAPISGKVLQSMNGGGYSYILLRKKGSDEQVWLAVPAMQTIVGKEMTFSPGMAMYSFQSKALNRTFDKIYFSSGPLGKQEGKKEKKEAKKSAGSKDAAAAAGGKTSVEKATGPDAYRVSELYRDKDKLNKKKVVVRGKVVKVAAGIMNRNWIHIQDGSGSAKKGTNDLVVTSDSLPAEGEVITVTGILAKDRDFGSNYRYKVIVEKAEIAIE
jgi:hypothetical protein